MTNYLICGCDCTGKTTLINEFLKHGTFDVRHCKNPPINLSQSDQKEYARQEYIRGIKDLNAGCDIIYDRFLLGECIYGPIFRNYYPDYMRELERTLNENTILIVLTASPELVLSRFDGKFIKPEQIPEILIRFGREFAASNIKRKLLVFVDDMTPEMIYDYIMEWEAGYSKPVEEVNVAEMFEHYEKDKAMHQEIDAEEHNAPKPAESPVKRKTKYNRTQLYPEVSFENHVFHRDIFAHYLRWSYLLKLITPNFHEKTLLDWGCGDGGNLATLYHNRRCIKSYLGIDIRDKTIESLKEKYANLVTKWVRFEVEDLCDPTMAGDIAAPAGKYGNSWDFITCFEVLEHIGKKNHNQFMMNIQSHMNQNTVLMISTPCYDAKVGAADNHMIEGEVGELTYAEMEMLLSKYFKIKKVYGTFASQKDYEKLMTPAQRQLFDELSEYYDCNLVSVIFAPLFPKQSRNCIWVCQLKEEKFYLGMKNESND